jgi:hypothetical protein
MISAFAEISGGISLKIKTIQGMRPLHPSQQRTGSRPMGGQARIPYGFKPRPVKRTLA